MTWDTPTQPTLRVCHDIIDERARQMTQWGVQRHDFPVWLVVLLEECGEAAQALLTLRAEGGQDQWLALRTELVHVAAVAVAAIEHLDEKGA